MTIQKEIFISKPSKTVFKILTNSNEILKYFPLNSVESTWKEGGDIILKGGEKGSKFTDYGIIDQLVENKKFQYSYWSDNHGTERIPENFLTISYTLTEVDQGTKLLLEHSNLKSEEMFNQMNGVWDFLLSNLKKYAESKE